MRKIVLYMFMTLDGFIAGPDGEFDDYEPSDEELAFANDFFASVDGIMFGRLTYEGFVSYWDALDPTDPAVLPAEARFAELFRAMTRVVFSRRLEHVPDNTILIRDDLATVVSALKQRPGRDFALVCGPALLATLVGLDLVDEVLVLVKPKAAGRGTALFGELAGELRLSLRSSRVFGSGVVANHYAVARSG